MEGLYASNIDLDGQTNTIIFIIYTFILQDSINMHEDFFLFCDFHNCCQNVYDTIGFEINFDNLNF